MFMVFVNLVANSSSRQMQDEIYRISLKSNKLSPHPGPLDETPRKSTELTKSRYRDMSDSIDADLLLNAEREVFDEEMRDNSVLMKFRIVHHVPFGEGLFIIGSVPELGSWEPENAIPLLWEPGDVWTVSVSVKRSEIPKFEYKYFVKAGEEPIRWENCRNHVLLRHPTPDMLVEDFWQFPGFNPNQK